MNTEKKLAFYEMRTAGKTQKEAAAALGVSERTCRRWEKEARAQLDADTENAKRAYSAKLDQKRSVAEAFTKLEKAITSIDFDNLSDAQKLELLLKYGRRMDEIDSRAPKMPEDVKLNGIAGEDMQTGNITILELQEKLFNMAAAGEITDEQARKKIALLTELRKSVAAADQW